MSHIHPDRQRMLEEAGSSIFTHLLSTPPLHSRPPTSAAPVVVSGKDEKNEMDQKHDEGYYRPAPPVTVPVPVPATVTGNNNKNESKFRQEQQQAKNKEGIQTPDLAHARARQYTVNLEERKARKAHRATPQSMPVGEKDLLSAKLITAKFRAETLAYPNIASVNYFHDHGIQHILVDGLMPNRIELDQEYNDDHRLRRTCQRPIRIIQDSPPSFLDEDNREVAMTPLMARRYHKTYASRVDIEMEYTTWRNTQVGKRTRKKSASKKKKKQKSKKPKKKKKSQDSEEEEDEEEDDDDEEKEDPEDWQKETKLVRHTLGWNPVMLQSSGCVLYGKTMEERRALGECEYDQGGYYIINGSDRMLVAQEYKRPNEIMVLLSKDKDKTPYATVLSESPTMNSMAQPSVCFNADNIAVVRLNGMPVEFPLLTVCIAMGAGMTTARIKYLLKLGSPVPVERLNNMMQESWHLENSDSKQSADHAIQYMTRLVNQGRVSKSKRKIHFTDDLHNRNKHNKHPDGDAEEEKKQKDEQEEYKEKEDQDEENEEKDKDEEDKEKDDDLQDDPDDADPMYADSLGRRKLHKLKMQNMRNALRYRLFPHIGTDDPTNADTIIKKVQFLAQMLHQLILFKTEKRNADVVDHMGNKSIASAGIMTMWLWKQEFQRFWGQACKRAITQINQHHLPLFNIIWDMHGFTKSLRYAFTTGMWPKPIPNRPRFTGVAVFFDRNNPIDYYAMLKRANNPIVNKGRSPEPMEVHNSQWGVYDGWATPEDKGCGTVHQMVILTCPRVPLSLDERERVLKRLSTIGLKMKTPDPESRGRIPFHICFDGAPLLRITYEPDLLAERIRTLRRNGQLPRHLSVVPQNGDHILSISHGWGDPVRAVICCEEKTGKPLLDLSTFERINGSGVPEKEWWKRLLAQNNLIDHIGVREGTRYVVSTQATEGTFSARMAKFAELSPCVIMGPTAAIMFYLGHQHSPRIQFAIHHARTAMALPVLTFLLHCKSKMHMLRYPQSMMKTPFGRATGNGDLSHTQYVRLVVAEKDGYIQEDPIIFNQSALDRELLASDQYRRYDAHLTFFEEDNGDMADPVDVVEARRAERKRQQQQQNSAGGERDEDRDVKMQQQQPNDGKDMQQQYSPPILEDEEGLPYTEHLVNPSLLTECEGANSRDYRALPGSDRCSSCRQRPHSHVYPPRDDCASLERAWRKTTDSSVFFTTALPLKNSTLRGSQVVIGIVRRYRVPETPSEKAARITRGDPPPYRYVDASIRCLKNQQGQVIKLFVHRLGRREVFVSVVVVTSWKMRIGDKVASTMAQKSTVDMTYRDEDMPWFPDGTAADMIIQESAFARMTIGQIHMMGLCRYLLLDESGHAYCNGEAGDHSWCGVHYGEFAPYNALELGNRLKAAGFSTNGRTCMRDPATGNLMPGRMYEGWMPTTKLQHIAEQKGHARTRGKKCVGNNQPVSGRANDGAFRVGDDDRKQIAADGAMGVSRHLFMELSDQMVWRLCSRCGMTAHRDPQTRVYSCKTCLHLGEIIESRAPGTLKAFQQHVFTAGGVALRIFPDKRQLLDSPEQEMIQMEQELRKKANRNAIWARAGVL